jgi:hypothetical protein
MNQELFLWAEFLLAPSVITNVINLFRDGHRVEVHNGLNVKGAFLFDCVLEKGNFESMGDEESHCTESCATNAIRVTS